MNVDRNRKLSSTPGREGSTSRRLRVVLPPLLVVLALAGIGWTLGIDQPASSDVVRDRDLCPIDEDRVNGDVVFLFDFTKPLGGLSAALPGQLLRDLTLELERDTEIRAYLLTGSADAPLAPLRRFCKPFDTAEVQVAQAKDQRGAVRDCDDLPAQVATDVRRSAARFCTVRDALQARIDALAAKASREQGTVASAHLVEALEDILTDFQEQPGPHRLHVFSDMMQHAHWYSHLDLDGAQWDYDEFSRLLASRDPVFGQRRPVPNAEFDIHYVPRAGRTTERRTREQHQQFWRGYFAGSSVTFHEQSPIPAYASRPLMGLASESRTALHVPVGMERFVVSARSERVALGQPSRQAGAAGGVPDVVVKRERPADAAAGRNRSTVSAPPRRVRRALAQQPEVPGPPGQQAEQPALSLQTPPAAPTESLAQAEALPDAVDPPGERPPDAPSPADSVAGLATRNTTHDRPAPKPLERSMADGDEAPLDIAGVQRSAPAMPSATPPETEPPLSGSGEEILVDPAGVDGIQTAGVDTGPCRLQRPAGFDRWQPEYPLRGQRDFGDAVITVRYAVDEAGETIDEETAVVRDRSSAALTRHFNRFARAAIDSVRDWKFSVAQQDTPPCAMDVSYVTTIRFQYD